MLDFIKDLYHKYSDTVIFETAGKIYRKGFFLSNFNAYLKVKRIADATHHSKGRIKVVFVCQYAQVWNKLRSVYEKMKQDDRYEAVILAVSENLSEPDDAIYEFFSKMYGEGVINAYQDGRWYDLKSENPDYVFIQRPYDQYLPKPYRSGTIAGYAKICYVDYAFILTRELREVCQNKRFFRNIYYFFAEDIMAKKFNINRFRISHNKGYRKTISIGYPVLEDFIRNGSKYERQDDGLFRVLWTPRWTEDKQLGGSNFMKYKDKALHIPDMGEQFHLIFRPHPMTFSHLISINRMTEEEAEHYIEEYSKNDRLEYDTSKDYTGVFWNTNVMITDISSVIVEYFVTGKPIIYCKTGAIPDEFFAEVLKVLYVVDTWEEAEEVLRKLAQGIDPLKQMREQKINELLGNEFLHISDRFLDEIYSDFIS